MIGADVLDLIDRNKPLQKPIIGIVKAGYDYYAEQNILGYEDVTDQEYMQGDYFLQVSGDSMTGSGIFDGSLVYVQSCQQVQDGEVAVVIINGDEGTIKKIRMKNNMLILEASNPAVETRVYSAQEVQELPIQIIGKVLYCKNTF